MKLLDLDYIIDDIQYVIVYKYDSKDKVFIDIFRGNWSLIPWDILCEELYRIKVKQGVLILEVYGDAADYSNM